MPPASSSSSGGLVSRFNLKSAAAAAAALAVTGGAVWAFGRKKARKKEGDDVELAVEAKELEEEADEKELSWCKLVEEEEEVTKHEQYFSMSI